MVRLANNSGHNTRGATRIVAGLRSDHFAAFDRLPPMIRHALWDGMSDYSAVEMAAIFDHLRAQMPFLPSVVAEVKLFEFIRANDENDVWTWAQQQGSSAHTQAGATIVRYDSRDRSRRRRRN